MHRIEIDALNALIVEQKRTNELLEQLISQSNEQKSPQPRGKKDDNK